MKTDKKLNLVTFLCRKIEHAPEHFGLYMEIHMGKNLVIGIRQRLQQPHL